VVPDPQRLDRLLTALRQNVNTTNSGSSTPASTTRRHPLQGKARDDSPRDRLRHGAQEDPEVRRHLVVRIDTIKNSDQPVYKKEFTINLSLAGIDPKKKKS
jgi:hypothetical protein